MKAQQLVEKAKRLQGVKRKNKVTATQKIINRRSKGPDAEGRSSKGKGKAEDDVIEVRSDSDSAGSGGRRRSSR